MVAEGADDASPTDQTEGFEVELDPRHIKDTATDSTEASSSCESHKSENVSRHDKYSIPEVSPLPKPKRQAMLEYATFGNEVIIERRSDRASREERDSDTDNDDDERRYETETYEVYLNEDTSDTFLYSETGIGLSTGTSDSAIYIDPHFSRYQVIHEQTPRSLICEALLFQKEDFAWNVNSISEDSTAPLEAMELQLVEIFDTGILSSHLASESLEESERVEEILTDASMKEYHDARTEPWSPRSLMCDAVPSESEEHRVADVAGGDDTKVKTAEQTEESLENNEEVHEGPTPRAGVHTGLNFFTNSGMSDQESREVPLTFDMHDLAPSTTGTTTSSISSSSKEKSEVEADKSTWSPLLCGVIPDDSSRDGTLSGKQAIKTKPSFETSISIDSLPLSEEVKEALECHKGLQPSISEKDVPMATCERLLQKAVYSPRHTPNHTTALLEVVDERTAWIPQDKLPLDRMIEIQHQEEAVIEIIQKAKASLRKEQARNFNINTLCEVASDLCFLESPTPRQELVMMDFDEVQKGSISLKDNLWDADMWEFIISWCVLMLTLGYCHPNEPLIEEGGIEMKLDDALTIQRELSEEELDSLKQVIVKRLRSPGTDPKMPTSSIPSEMMKLVHDLCFLGHPRKLSRQEGSLLLETAAHVKKTNRDASVNTPAKPAVEPINKPQNEPLALADDTCEKAPSEVHPFDEIEPTKSLAMKILESNLKNGNGFASKDLIDLSGNVSRVPISKDRSSLHIAMAEGKEATEVESLPVCGAWQIEEILLLQQEVQAWIRQFFPRSKDADPVQRVSGQMKPISEESRVAVENEACSEGQMPRSGSQSLVILEHRDETSCERYNAGRCERDICAEKEMRKPFTEVIKHTSPHSPRRVYSVHKFQRNVGTIGAVRDLCFLGPGAVSYESSTLLGATHAKGTKLCPSQPENRLVLPQIKTSSYDQIDRGYEVLVGGLVIDTNTTFPFDEVDDDDIVIIFHVGAYVFSDIVADDRITKWTIEHHSMKLYKEGMVVLASKELLPLYPVLEAMIAQHHQARMSAHMSYMGMCHASETLEVFQDIRAWLADPFLRT